VWYTSGKRKGGYVLKDSMEKLMKGLKDVKSEEYKMGYADGCLDMYSEAAREYEEIFAEQGGNQ
jgi:hypothetical protein